MYGGGGGMYGGGGGMYGGGGGMYGGGGGMYGGGGGMYGGMGGMMGGMGGMGGMMGGMGGYGGGMGGMGGYGGGMYGGMGGMGGGVGNWQSQYRGYQLIMVIQQTIEPQSWYEEGGEGRMNQYSENKLLVWQTPEVHKQITEFLEMLRVGLGEQVAIETRFLLVGENFLEDIGVDLHTINLRVGGPFNELGPGQPGFLGFAQSTADHVIPTGSNVPGSLAGVLTQPGLSLTSNVTFDDLFVDFIIRATQSHRNSRTLTAPKAVVMNGESASLSVDTETRIVSGTSLVTESVGTGDVPLLTTYWDRTLEGVNTGIQMSITPTITADKKYVLLLINANLTDLLAVSTQQVTAVGPNNELLTDQFTLPTTQNSSIQTRVNVPDRGTVMLGGLTLTAETERESGVPILSKIPILNLLFSNRSLVKDKHILLILVKPTIMLQEENEQDAIAAMDEGNRLSLTDEQRGRRHFNRRPFFRGSEAVPSPKKTPNE